MFRDRILNRARKKSLAVIGPSSSISPILREGNFWIGSHGDYDKLSKSL
jgi:hypothetical protein